MKTIHLEKTAQLLARVRTAETVRAQHLVAPRNVRAYLIRIALDVIGRGDHRAAAHGEALLDVTRTPAGFWMQHVPALAIQPVAAQFVETGHAPDVGAHTEILFQQFRRRDDLAQNRPAAEQLHRWFSHFPLPPFYFPKKIHSLD